ncbi:hypothetical protein [Spirosoma pomorum]
MANYYVRNQETDRLELHFDKATYQALDQSVKKEIKRFFLFSRTAGAWVSKSSLQGAATWSAANIAEKLKLEDQGKKGEKVNEVDLIERRRAKSARLSNATDTFIDWEQYTPSERLNRDHDSVSFFDHDYPKAFRGEIKETIADIQQRLGVTREEDLPDYVKSAIERYAKALSSYYTRYVNNRTYAPSPMVVGPARYPWHKLEKAHQRDGKNFSDLDDAKDRLKNAVNRVQRGAADAKPTPEYLQNRINEAQAEVNRMQRGVDKGQYLDHYQPRLKQSQELLAYWEKQLADAGGLRWSKEKLKNVGATHIQYNGYKYLPIIKVNEKTVTVGRWLTNESTTPYNVPFSKVTGYLVRWEDALMKRPGEKAAKGPKEEKAFKKGDKGLYLTGYSHRPVQLVTITTVGQKFYHVRGNLYGDKLPFAKVVPVATGHQERLAKLLAAAEPKKSQIIHALTHPDDPQRYDLQHFLSHVSHPYREDLLALLKIDLITAGYPEKGGLVAFFTDKYGINKAKKQAKPVKNAARRKAATTKKTAKSGRNTATRKKVAQRSLKTVVAATTVAPLSVVSSPVVASTSKQAKQAKTGEKVKLTAAQKKQIRKEGIETVDAALAKKKTELTAAQVIKLGQRINFLRTHIIIDGQVYQVREDFDTPTTNKRRLAPTEDNLKKWAANPGRYDLIGVDAAGKVDVTVFKKRDRNKVPTKLKVRKIGKGLTKLRTRIGAKAIKSKTKKS